MHSLFIPSAAPRPHTAPAASAEVTLTLLGPSTAMSQLWAQIRRLAPHIRTVLLTGAPGAGQEAVARLLLDLSPLPRRAFLVLTETEAEERLGRPSSLNTLPVEAFLFLPEVDRLSAAAQAGLLRLLRTRRSQNFSVAVATAEDLRAMVSVGRFSAELAEALGAVRVAVPSLKDRSEDLPMLLNQMFALRCQAVGEPLPQLTEDLLRAAMQHSWPRNLEELSDVVELLLTQEHAKGGLSAVHLERALAQAQPSRHGEQPARMIKLDTVLQEHIFAVLRACRGNKLRAAEVLGISRSTLYRMLDAAARHQDLPLAS